MMVSYSSPDSSERLSIWRSPCPLALLIMQVFLVPPALLSVKAPLLAIESHEEELPAVVAFFYGL